MMSNDDTGYRIDIEPSCDHAMDTISILSTLAENHSCDSSGCYEGFIMADSGESK